MTAAAMSTDGGEVLLADLTLHDDLQARAELDARLVEEYAQLLVDGSEPPPIEVFDVGDGKLYLADGYTRFHAAQVCKRERLPANLHHGTFDDAIRFAVSANFRHGKRPSSEDARKAYKIVKRRGLLDIRTDGIAQRVAEMFGCSIRWAFHLAQTDIDALQAEKQAKVFSAKAEGKSNRQAAKEAGVSYQTANNWVDPAKKLKGAEICHPGPAWTPDDIPSTGREQPEPKPAPEPVIDFAAAAEQKRAEAAILRNEPVAEHMKGFSEEWRAEENARRAHGDLVRALNRLVELPDPAEMHAMGYRAMDYEIDPKVDLALAWLTNYRDLRHD